MTTIPAVLRDLRRRSHGRRPSLRHVGDAVLSERSGYKLGTLFRWIVSDFSLIDAIESAIVKVPRFPVADDSMTGEQTDLPRFVDSHSR